MIRTKLGNILINWGRSLGRSDGRELAVVLDEHDIRIGMEQPDKSDRAWDEHLYHKGNVFMDGYANPIKPAVHVNKALDEPDEVDMVMGDGGDEIDAPEDADQLLPTDEDAEPQHASMISSERYQKFMHQDLISQLLTPTEQWRLILIAVLAVAFLVVINIMVAASAAGVI